MKKFLKMNVLIYNSLHYIESCTIIWDTPANVININLAYQKNVKYKYQNCFFTYKNLVELKIK